MGVIPLLPLFLCVVLASTGEQMFRKVVTSNMYNYRWFLLQVRAMSCPRFPSVSFFSIFISLFLFPSRVSSRMPLVVL